MQYSNKISKNAHIMILTISRSFGDNRYVWIDMNRETMNSH